MVQFRYRDKTYQVDRDEAYAKDRIVLPNGCLLAVAWSEADPPTPVQFNELASHWGDALLPSDIAEMNGAAMAEEVA